MHHGIDVRAWDLSPAARNPLTEKVKVPITQLAEMGLSAATLGSLSIFTEMSAALAGVLFVQENAPDVIETKHKIYRIFESCAGPDALIASERCWPFLVQPKC